jgi:hypothetical protein
MSPETNTFEQSCNKGCYFSTSSVESLEERREADIQDAEVEHWEDLIRGEELERQNVLLKKENLHLRVILAAIEMMRQSSSKSL